nr:hypothetical protein Itr_chr10CG02690 [Ipomoea trifida]
MVNVRLLEATVKSNTVLGQWGARSTPSAAGINLVRVIVLDEGISCKELQFFRICMVVDGGGGRRKQRIYSKTSII